MKQHSYAVTVKWTAAPGSGTRSYRDYDRSHAIMAEDKSEIAGSADPSFLGDPARWNPEELLVASLSACHKLWFLALCAQAGIEVVDYIDEAGGTMVEEKDGAGQFEEVVLRPQVTIAGGDIDMARSLHEKAHRMCFIARSVNFPVRHEASIAMLEN